MIEEIMGIVLSIGDGEKKSRVFTSKGILHFSAWSYKPKRHSFKECLPGDLVEVLIDEWDTLIGVREI